jgi:RimJ/RimL family protein N-acetyltransferase
VDGLSTARLLLRDWREEDLEPLAVMYADPEVMRFVGDGSVYSREQTVSALLAIRDHWRRHGFGKFAVESRASGELVGWVGLGVPAFLPQVLPAVGIGWRLNRGHWGRGLATEAAQAVLRHGFDDLGLGRIVGICHADHHASARIMVKLGMQDVMWTTAPGSGRPVHVMAVTRDEADPDRTRR